MVGVVAAVVIACVKVGVCALTDWRDELEERGRATRRKG